MQKTSWPARIATWLTALVMGIVFGAAGTAVHAVTWGPVPVGMMLSAVAIAGILIALRLLLTDRWVVLIAGLGMLLVVLLLSGEGPGGSVVVPDTLLGRIWGYVVAGILLLVVAWPDVSRQHRATET